VPAGAVWADPIRALKRFCLGFFPLFPPQVLSSVDEYCSISVEIVFSDRPTRDRGSTPSPFVGPVKDLVGLRSIVALDLALRFLFSSSVLREPSCLPLFRLPQIPVNYNHETPPSSPGAADWEVCIFRRVGELKKTMRILS